MIRLRKNVWTIASVACLSALLFFLIQDAGAAARAGNQGAHQPDCSDRSITSVATNGSAF